MKKSILMLASLALLSACNKESNEPAVQQEQKDKSGVSISMSGQIELPEQLARGLEFQPYDKNGRTSYTPFFNDTNIPALVCFYNEEEDNTTENAPYVMRQIVLGVHNEPGPGGRMVSKFYFKEKLIDTNERLFQDHLKDAGRRRDKAKVSTNPETLRMTLIVGFEVKDGNNASWDNQPIYSSETFYEIGTKLDLTQPINYWVNKRAKTNIARPIFAAFDVKPSAEVADGIIAFSNVKLTMVGTIIKARITNNDSDPHRIVGFRITNVGGSALNLEAPTRVEIPDTRKKRLVPPAIAANGKTTDAVTEHFITYEFPQEKKMTLGRDKSAEWLVYLPLNKTQSGGRADGPVFEVMYDPVDAKPKYGVKQKLKPLKRDGLIVSHEFRLKR
jgi:lipoprotein